MRKSKKASGLLIEEKKWHNWLVSQLRRISYKWPERTKAKKEARVSYGVYRCNICKGEWPAKSVQLDHRAPVLSTTHGFTDWDSYIKRLFVNSNGFQVLCKPCHKEKTTKENARRAKRK